VVETQQHDAMRVVGRVVSMPTMHRIRGATWRYVQYAW
jgi:hypothetical protein